MFTLKREIVAGEKPKNVAIYSWSSKGRSDIQETPIF